MKKFDVLIALEKIRDAKGEWAKAITDFNADIEMMMRRLLREAAVNYMSADEVAKASGFTVKRVRILMRSAGLDPKRGKRLLSKIAADTLADNAALMGIEPHEMDLMSPLAYLPMGKQMRRELEERSVSQVTELEETMEEALTNWTEIHGWEDERTGERVVSVDELLDYARSAS
jgi:hypothetical protein